LGGKVTIRRKGQKEEEAHRFPILKSYTQRGVLLAETRGKEKKKKIRLLQVLQKGS